MSDEVNAIDSLLGDDQLRNEISTRYNVAKDYYSGWKEVAEEDYNFALGEQWTQEEKDKLEKDNRPCLTFNRIKPLLSVIAGYQRENSARIKVAPEGGEDRVFSEIMDRVLKAIDKWSKLSYKLGYLFDDGVYCGKGFIEGLVDYAKDPIRGELKFINDGPYRVLVDPDCEEYNINDGAEYVFKVCKFTKDKLKAMYPNKKKVVAGLVEDVDDPEVNVTLEGDDDDYGNRPTGVSELTKYKAAGGEPLERDEKFTHKEYWRKKYVTKYFVIDRESGEPKKFDSKDDADYFALTQGDNVRVIDRTMPEMWVAAMVGGHILQDIKSPFEPYYSGYPFFRFLADWAPFAKTEEMRVQGVTRSLKDPQREKNKAKSQFLHVINTQANSGWIGDEDALNPKGWEELKKIGASPGIVIPKKRGSELREILPKGPDTAQMMREQAADQEFKQISNINPDMLGFQEGTTSGRAIALRIKQAVLSLVRLFHNYRYTKEIIGLFILQMIPSLFNTKKLSKVLGPQFLRSFASPEMPEGIIEGRLDAYLKMIEDQKYDIEVTESDNASTAKAEALDYLMELTKTPQGGLIPIELIIDYMDIPNAEDVKARIAQAKQAAAQAAAGANNPAM